MALRVVGAGLGRTGTHSLKLALEQILGEPCYHMTEVPGHEGHIEAWHRAVDGEMPDWGTHFAGFGAAVDWPTAAFWREIAADSPDAIVVLSVRDTESWWRSAINTIFLVPQGDPPADPVFARQVAMAKDLLTKRFTTNWLEEAEAKHAYEAHNDAVRAEVAPERLVEWHPGDGWEPICTALGVAVPDEPFPHVNTTADFRRELGFDLES